jgi:RNA polymerase sigma-70 factor (ECF subfamily)
MPARRKLRFRQDIQPHLEILFRTAFRLTGNLPDAEDLMQETCIRAIKHLQDLDPDNSIAGWLMRVQFNVYLDQQRARQRAATVSLDAIDPAELRAPENAEPERRAHEDQKFEAIYRAMARLKPEQRALLVLRVEGYSLNEMRDITGLGIPVLNLRLHRARQSLARLLRADWDATTAKQHMEAGR